MEHGIARAKQILAAAEATDICVNSPILYGGWHLLGTARMGGDPATSVLNSYNQAWDVGNLFVTDAASFTSSGYHNPTLTIMALTVRACGYLADQLDTGAL